MEQGGDLAKPGKIRGKAYKVLDRGCGQIALNLDSNFGCARNRLH